MRGRVPVARKAHNLEVVGSIPTPATAKTQISTKLNTLRYFYDSLWELKGTRTLASEKKCESRVSEESRVYRGMEEKNSPAFWRVNTPATLRQTQCKRFDKLKVLSLSKD